MIRPGNGQIDDQQRNPRSEIVTNASVDYQHTLPVVSERYLEAVIYNVKKQSKCRVNGERTTRTYLTVVNGYMLKTKTRE